MINIVGIVQKQFLKEWREKKVARKAKMEAEGRKNLFHDSDAAMCLRKRVVKRAGLVEEAEPIGDGLMTMEIGTLVHQAFQDRLVKAGAVAIEDVEVVLRDEHTSNRSDFVCNMNDAVTPDAGNYMVELKTVAHSAFKWIQSDGQAKLPNRLQALRGFRKHKEKYELKGIIIIYISREYGNTLQMAVPIDDELNRLCDEDLASELQAWEAYQATGELPEEITLTEMKELVGLKGERVMVERKTDTAWACEYCNLFKACGPMKALVSKDSPDRDFSFFKRLTEKENEVKKALKLPIREKSLYRK